MRLFVCCLLAALCIATNAFADNAAFRQQVFSHLAAHHPDYPEELKAQLGDAHSMVIFSIDRDGKLLDERVTKGSGRKIADQKALEAPLHFTVEIDFTRTPWNDDRIKRAMQNVCKGC